VVCCVAYSVDTKDGTMTSKPLKNKGYIVDVTSTYDTRSMPPSYYRATPSQAGGRSGTHDSQTIDSRRPIVVSGGDQSDVGAPRYHTHGGGGGGGVGNGSRPGGHHDQSRYRTATEPSRHRRGSF